MDSASLDHDITCLQTPHILFAQRCFQMDDITGWNLNLNIGHIDFNYSTTAEVLDGILALIPQTQPRAAASPAASLPIP